MRKWRSSISIQATLGSDAKRGVPQKSEREDRWRQSREFGKSTNGLALATFAKPAASPAKTSPLQQPACRRATSPSCQSGAAPRAARLVVEPCDTRAQTKLPRTRHPKHGTAAQETTEAMDGVVQVPAVEFSLRGVHSVAGNDVLFCLTPWVFCVQPAQVGISGKSIPSSGVSTCRRKHGEAVPNRYSALQNRFSFQLPMPFHPLVVICSVVRYVLDDWTSVRDPLLHLAREVLMVHSSPASGRILTYLLPVPYRPAVIVNVPVERVVWDLLIPSSPSGCSQ